jgi:DNA-binding MarR family transcriptional regulator
MLPSLVGYALRRAQLGVFADFAEAMRAADVPLTPGEFGILQIVGSNDSLTQTALARALGVDRSTLVPVLNRLEGARLIERRKSPTDKRAHALALGYDGDRLLERYEALVRAHEARLLAPLSASERRQLIRLLERLLDAVRN